MADREIERRFFADPKVVAGRKGEQLWQAYIPVRRTGVVVRVRWNRRTAWLTVKRSASAGVRHEFEVEIPRSMARELLRSLGCAGRVVKRRYMLRYGGRRWEVDVFEGNNRGLVIAEVELPSLDTPVRLPPWVGEEITSRVEFSNAALARRPFRRWPRAQQERVHRAILSIRARPYCR
jgi:adenylate cyclase